VKFTDFGKDPEDTLRKIREEFGKGSPVILPTDTVYGLAAPLNRPDAISMIFDLKERPEGMTLPVAVASVDAMKEVACVDDQASRYIGERLPGPFTFVLESRIDENPYVVRSGTVAVRVVDHPLFPPLCRDVGPMALTSANVHGRDPVMSAQEAEYFFERTDLLMVIDGSRLTGIPSTVIDLTGNVQRTLREGKVNMENGMGGNDGRG